MDDLRRRLEELARLEGMSLFGVADLERLGKGRPGLFRDLPRKFTRAVSMGVRLSATALEEIVDRPTVTYFHLYRQANYALDRAGFRVADQLERAGHASLAVPASQIIGTEPMRGHVSHREIAQAAGLGWRGRNNLLVNAQLGSRLRLVTVLTDAPLKTDEPSAGDCGICRACIEVCPAQAIHEDPEAFDLEACYSKLCEFRRIAFIGQHICGVCVKACGPKIREK